uniref:Uncharacterized protein n=1 Tax=Cacopsylla melanoneura TaxID=428564 RepID=A0A8D8PU81_9HEMI
MNILKKKSTKPKRNLFKGFLERHFNTNLGIVPPPRNTCNLKTKPTSNRTETKMSAAIKGKMVSKILLKLMELRACENEHKPKTKSMVEKEKTSLFKSIQMISV